MLRLQPRAEYVFWSIPFITLVKIEGSAERKSETRAFTQAFYCLEYMITALQV